MDENGNGSRPSVNPLRLPRMVFNPFRNLVQFRAERLLLSGTMGRLLVVGIVIAGVSFFAGALGYLIAHGTEQSFDNPLQAVWWAFLRLSDPGYLGDDQGFLLVAVSTLLTVTGCVLFFGCLVAILTQGLNEKVRQLEMGLTPISARNHVVQLGWSNRTPAMVRNFVASEARVKRFLRRVGARKLKLVILVDEVQAWHSEELRTALGPDWDDSQVILRSGSPLRLDHLMRVDFLRASALVLPARDRETPQSASESDNAVMKTMLSVSRSFAFARAGNPPPLLVAELNDARKIPTALGCYQGPVELVAGDEVLSRMTAQMVRNPQISDVYRELLTQGTGNEIFVRDCPPSMTGQLFWDLARTRSRAILIGVIRRDAGNSQPSLNPDPDLQLENGDRLVYLATEWSDIEATPTPDAAGDPWPRPSKKLERRTADNLTVLILGWSRRIPALLAEFDTYTNQQFEITIASRVPVDERESQMRHYGASLERVRVEHIDRDSSVPDLLLPLRPEDFESVLCLASDASDTDEEADARTLVIYSILRNHFAAINRGPRILLELLDELNVALLDPTDSEYLLSSQLLSHMLVQVTLRSELNPVFQALFNSSDTDILFRDFERYGVACGTDLAFREIERLARTHGEIALGIFKRSERQTPNGGVYLNPERQSIRRFEDGDKLVVLKGCSK